MKHNRDRADLEYAIMLAILNFHTEFMKLKCARVEVHIAEDTIDVTLARSGAIPAEARLAQSEEGKALLRQVHDAMFVSCQDVLRDRIEPIVGRTVGEMIPSLDPTTWQSRITIKCCRPLTATSLEESVRPEIEPKRVSEED